jgi:hypothetical protein
MEEMENELQKKQPEHEPSKFSAIRVMTSLALPETVPSVEADLRVESREEGSRAEQRSGEQGRGSRAEGNTADQRTAEEETERDI